MRREDKDLEEGGEEKFVRSRRRVLRCLLVERRIGRGIQRSSGERDRVIFDALRPFDSGNISERVLVERVREKRGRGTYGKMRWEVTCDPETLLHESSHQHFSQFSMTPSYESNHDSSEWVSSG